MNSRICHLRGSLHFGHGALRNAAEFYFDVISSKYEEAAANSKVPAT